MEKLVRYCDHCGQAKPGTARFSLEVGSQMDGAGSRDYISDEIDLCPEAMKLVIERVIKFQGRAHGMEGSTPLGRHDYNKAFLTRWKQAKA